VDQERISLAGNVPRLKPVPYKKPVPSWRFFTGTSEGRYTKVNRLTPGWLGKWSWWWQWSLYIFL